MRAKTSETESKQSAAKASAQAQPARRPEHPLHQLQHTIGNQAVGRLIQARLKVSQPGDEYEQEADRIADQVMGMPDSEKTISSDGSPASVQTKCAECADGGGACPKCAAEEASVQRQSLASPITPVVQRALDVCEMPQEEEVTSGPVEEATQSIAEEEPTQGQETLRAAEQTQSEEPSLQRSADGGLYASADVTRKIESTKGQGGSLPGSIQQEFGSKMGADFSGVRIHTDGNAAQLNSELASHAFTHGNDIYFDQGKYNPESAEGKHLLAHELAHTIQQQGDIKSVRRLTVTPTGNFVKGACGSRQRTWIFELSSPAPEDGYIVQKVDVYEDVKDCPMSASCILNPTLTFWEAWWLLKGETLQHIHSQVGWTDRSSRGAGNNKSGFDVAAGEIKFYPKSVTGDLGREDVLSSDPTSTWKPGNQGGVPRTGWLPSTTSPPSWWTSAPTEGPATRQAYSAWHCCGKGDFNVIKATP
jgi:hypothetical protein